MKIYLVCLLESTYDAMLELYRQAEPKVHVLVDDPEEADMILFVGRWSFYGNGVVGHPLPKKYPEKTFVYNDDDILAPLLPGVYASAEQPRLFRLNRQENQKFIDWRNEHVQPIEAEKKYLFSFSGRSSSWLRKRLFRIDFGRSDVFIEDTSYYDHWTIQPDREENQKRYVRTLAESRFALCPKGASAGSYRLFEVMEMGIAPVILSDRYILPEGPDWDSFALRVPESRIGDLAQIVDAHAHEAEERGRLARKAYEEWFDSPKVFNHVVSLCERIKARRRVPERWVQPFWRLMLLKLRLVRGMRNALRAAILWVRQTLSSRSAGTAQFDAE
ncbi:glycosyltransferase family 47 protein [Edaphobacter flagellatus]|uniref:glycosyltransferase family 47 protein n=1 Tax=Edaphobacter flagellatus TaxID=1933044 RepID=UPI0021B3C2DA|nr:glycosyltransferase family 47 protein [Edaphobacter flagellatus]